MGTENMRAPEIIDNEVSCYEACDIYSAGIILFVMISQGSIPYTEEKQPIKGFFNFKSTKRNQLQNLLNTDPEKFWSYHLAFKDQKFNGFTEDFKELF
mmetsp:Transcript_32582/g.29440  ORF Transcript_32582/g.29440 Transcript_32582/m.29440 type:complete len:98 (-) Transcript_32582:332-625(-)